MNLTKSADKNTDKHKASAMTKLLRAVKDIMSTKTDCSKVEAVFHQMSPFVSWSVFEKVWYFLLGLFLPPTSSEFFLSASESAALSSVAATIVSPSSLPSLHLVQVHPSQSPQGQLVSFLPTLRLLPMLKSGCTKLVVRL